MYASIPSYNEPVKNLVYPIYLDLDKISDPAIKHAMVNDGFKKYFPNITDIYDDPTKSIRTRKTRKNRRH